MAAPAPKLKFLPDLVEEHYEELQFLWSARKQMLRSPSQYLRDLRHFEERIEAHVQGLLIAGDQLATVVGPGLGSKAPDETFAAAYALLRSPNPAWHDQVLATFAASVPPALHGIKEALAHAPIPPSLLRKVYALLGNASPHVAVAAAEVLAFHGARDASGLNLGRFVQHEDPGVRAGAWRVAGLLGVALDSKLYSLGLRDKDPVSRREAMHAAAWARQQGILSYCRQVAQNPVPENIDALRLLAILGGPEDLPLILAAGAAAPLKADRFALLGAYGHPACLDLILPALAHADPATAAAAGGAFTKITGVDVGSPHAGEVSLDSRAESESPDEFEAEFTAPVVIPDPDKAVAEWAKLKPRFARSARICQGCDLSHPVAAVPIEIFTTEARWETCLRMNLYGVWSGRPLELEQIIPNPSPVRH